MNSDRRDRGSSRTDGVGPRLSRRALLRIGVAGGTAVVFAPLLGCGFLDSRNVIDTVGKVDFRNPLRIPPLADPVRRGEVLEFSLVARKGRTPIVPQGETTTWGLNGSILGPTLRAARGDTVRVHVTNELDERTTLHWHGMRLPAAADGGPHQMVEPGDTWSPSWRIDQPAATLWYHPHPHGDTEIQVYRGLGGLFIVDDDGDLDLPHTYGVDDIPVLVQDKTFDDDGELVETSRQDNGMIGDTILVNGTAAPVLEVTARRTRLRLLNASTARSYAFGLPDSQVFTMIASDGGLLPEPIELDRIVLTPGERAEIIVEMAPGQVTTLRSYPQDLGLSRTRNRSTGSDDTLDVLQLRAADQLTDSPPIPTTLASIDRLHPAEATETREFELRNNRINGESMDMNRIDEVVTVDTVEVWEVWNGHRQPHNFHVHDVQFQVIDIAGAAPPAHLAGWKDTIYLPPDERIRLIMRFGRHSDPSTPYMYHCHLLWHEDEGMMGQFVVVEPGQQPGPIESGHGH